MKANVVTIDPSVRSVGVAVWSYEPSTWRRPERPKATYLWRPKSTIGDTFVERSFAMASLLEDLLDQLEDVVYVASEMPEFFTSSGGFATAASGSLMKLDFVVGVFGGVCHARGIEFKAIPVRDWKGQLPKTGIMYRIKKLLGNDVPYQKDEWDAVGIGLHLKGLL